MTMPSLEPLLTVPYVSLAEFSASPTWLDLDDLIENGTASQQSGELFNQLLKASAWADNYIRQPFRAHYVVEDLQCRVDSRGRIYIHPKHKPIRQVVAVSYGADPTMMQAITSFGSTNGTSVWVEDQNGVIIALGGLNGAWANSLQLGPAAVPYQSVYVQVEYIAGYGHGVLQATAAAGVNSLGLDTVLGFQAPTTSFAGTSYGASVARIWDPLNPNTDTGPEEAITVSAVNAGSNSLTFSSNLLYAHAAGCQVSELPAEVKSAVTSYACGLLLRNDASEDMPWPGSQGPSANRADSRGVAGGLINEAELLLNPYRRIR